MNGLNANRRSIQQADTKKTRGREDIWTVENYFYDRSSLQYLFKCLFRFNSDQAMSVSFRKHHGAQRRVPLVRSRDEYNRDSYKNKGSRHIERYREFPESRLRISSPPYTRNIYICVRISFTGYSDMAEIENERYMDWMNTLWRIIISRVL